MFINALVDLPIDHMVMVIRDHVVIITKEDLDSGVMLLV
jgi:hypothetical protein